VQEPEQGDRVPEVGPHGVGGEPALEREVPLIGVQDLDDRRRQLLPNPVQVDPLAARRRSRHAVDAAS
jgi:hypothetical protein